GINVYSPAEDRHDPDRLALLGDLRAAMDNRELVLRYQPKVDLASGQVCGVEALVRWNHPERGLVNPGQFIPLAEQTGLIGPLTRYLLRSALAQARCWSDQDRPLTISVNLAARNLTDEALYDDIIRALHDHGVPASLLRLELTESAVVTEPGLARRLLGRLHAAGITIALDDFGAGYTSLRQLTNLPITELKIDRAYVAVMATDARSAIIVESMVRLADNLNLTTVAEGVEDAATVAALRRVGCQLGQGYYFARPVAAEALDRRHPATSLAAFTAGG
ncbi:MAG TPA: EAL domain-containing protein, partial [Catenuloplanes sp.]